MIARKLKALAAALFAINEMTLPKPARRLSRSKYDPHQSKRELDRRLYQQLRLRVNAREGE